MRSKYKTLLSLSEFFEYVGLSRWLGAQIAHYRTLDTSLLKPIQFDNKLKKGCYDIYFEELYITQQVARDDISLAIFDAEVLFHQVMGFFPAPVATNEYHHYTGFYNHLSYSGGGMYDVHGYTKRFEVNNKRLIALGVYEWEFIGYFDATMTDLNGDGVQETIILDDIDVPIGTTCDQIEVYFRDADFPYGGIEDNVTPEGEWKVYPIEGYIVNADNGDDTMTYRVQFSAYCGVKPNLQMTEFPRELVANVPENFSDSFRVFVRSIDSEQHGHLGYQDDCVWENVTDICFGVDGNYFYPSATTGALTCQHGLKPNRVGINYVSGCTRQRCGRMDMTCGMMVAFLAAANLPCQPCGCGCEGKKHPLSFYSELYKEGLGDNGSDLTVADSARDRQNPFGPRNGQVMAWRLAKYLNEKPIHVILP